MLTGLIEIQVYKLGTRKLAVVESLNQSAKARIEDGNGIVDLVVASGFVVVAMETSKLIWNASYLPYCCYYHLASSQ